MKYFIIYLSSASKLEIEEFTHVVNAEARKKELFDGQMIPARLIHGTNLSTDFALAAHKQSLDVIIDGGAEEEEEVENDEVDVTLALNETGITPVMNEKAGSSYLNDSPTYADGNDSEITESATEAHTQRLSPDDVATETSSDEDSQADKAQSLADAQH